jgi:hypothetical protein
MNPDPRALSKNLGFFIGLVLHAIINLGFNS